jgi:DNA uptake protein ComE-like DNA-binding protein
MKLRTEALVLVLAGVAVAACSPKVDPEFAAACEGPKIRTVEQRQKAMEDGVHNRRFDCIDKAALAAEKQQRAEYAAANTPEAIEKRKEEFARAGASAAEARRSEPPEPTRPEPPLPTSLPRVEANTANEAEIAAILTVGHSTAAQIVEERKKGRFKGWDDLVARVVPLSQAQPAAFASVFGLVVNGESLPGAEPNSPMAGVLYQKYRQQMR